MADISVRILCMCHYFEVNLSAITSGMATLSDDKLYAFPVIIIELSHDVITNILLSRDPDISRRSKASCFPVVLYFFFANKTNLPDRTAAPSQTYIGDLAIRLARK